MSVRKIRNSWWVDFRFDFVRYRKRSPDNSHAGAKAYEATLRQRLARGEPLVPAKAEAKAMPTFAEFAEEWLGKWVPANCKPGTALHYRCLMRTNLAPHFGHLRLDHIEAQQIDGFKAARKALGRGGQTINNDLTVLSSCLRTAVEWGLIPEAPPVRWCKVHLGDVTFLDFEETRRLILATATVQSPWREMILLGLHTGMRFGEMAALDWTDVDLNTPRVTVRHALSAGELSTPKNGRSRHIPLTRTIVNALRPHVQNGGLVFRGSSGGYVPRDSRVLKQACRWAGIKPVSWHKLRHTFASHLVMRGVPLPVVQKLMGHATIAMTMRYAHLAPSVVDQAVNVLDDGGEKFGHAVVNATPIAAVSEPLPAAA